MSIVISEVEHRPAADGASDGSSEAGAAALGAVRIDGEQVLTILRREITRKARLWAD